LILLASNSHLRRRLFNSKPPQWDPVAVSKTHTIPITSGDSTRELPGIGLDGVLDGIPERSAV